MAEREAIGGSAARSAPPRRRGGGWLWLLLMSAVLAAILSVAVPHWFAQLRPAPPPPGMSARAPALPHAPVTGALSAAGATLTQPSPNASAGPAGTAPPPAQPALLEDVVYLVRAAQDHLTDARDVRGAMALLARAAGLLRAANQPDRAALLAALAADSVALRAYATYDRDALLERLAALDARWDSLPLVLASFHATPGATAAAAGDETATPRRYVGVLSHLKSLVRIRTDRMPGELPVVDARQSGVVRQTLHLHTQRAVIAVLRQQRAGYVSGLAAARQLVADSFIANDPAVVRAREELAQLVALDMTRPLPRLASLGLLAGVTTITAGIPAAGVPTPVPSPAAAAPRMTLPAQPAAGRNL